MSNDEQLIVMRVKRKCVLVFIAALWAMLLGACADKQGEKQSLAATPDFFGLSDNLARQLVANRRDKTVDGERIVLTTFVTLDDLAATSGLGRTLTEGLAAGLFRQGFRVADIRKANGLYMRQKSGEFVLTRNAALAAHEEEAHAIVVGTYALTPRSVIVNARMIEADSNEVLSVAGLEIERGPNINFLLTPDGAAFSAGQMSAYER